MTEVKFTLGVLQMRHIIKAVKTSESKTSEHARKRSQEAAVAFMPPP